MSANSVRASQGIKWGRRGRLSEGLLWAASSHRIVLVFTTIVFILGLHLPAGGTHFAGGEFSALRIRDIDVRIFDIDYADGVARGMIELEGVWDDTDIVHVIGEVRFDYKVRGKRARIVGIRFRGDALVTGDEGTETFRTSGRISGIFIDDIIIGALGIDPELEFGARRGLLLPAVQ